MNRLELLNISENGRSASLRSLEDSLLSNKIKIMYENGIRIAINWFSYIKYTPFEGVLEIMFNKDLEKCLLNIKDNFTKYKLGMMLKFKSIYSMRLYELLKQYELIQTRTIEINELRLLIGLEGKKYSKYADLKKRIILSAKKEINAIADISFEFEEIKRGKKIHSIKFYIKSQKDTNFIQTNNRMGYLDDTEIDAITEEIKSIVDKSISRDTIKALIKEYGIENVNYYLNNWHKFSNVDMKSKAGFFIDCIKKNYTPSEQQIGKPIQSMNYEQRQYDDDHYDSLYANLNPKIDN